MDGPLSAHNIPPHLKVEAESYWWRFAFKNDWSDTGKADLAVDLLLADAVVSPVLDRHIDDITYWRFHRRAARDKTGHQFSFLFYSRPETASAIFAELNRSPLLEKIINAGIVETVRHNDPDYPLLPNVQDTSDPHWSKNLQKNWPAFIMGASSLWLGLIHDSLDESPEDFDDVHLLLEKYREIDAEIRELWAVEGEHALLHHLNAVFGYTPMNIRMVF